MAALLSSSLDIPNSRPVLAPSQAASCPKLQQMAFFRNAIHASLSQLFVEGGMRRWLTTSRNGWR
jgi:hypothetical protein